MSLTWRQIKQPNIYYQYISIAIIFIIEYSNRSLDNNGLRDFIDLFH